MPKKATTTTKDTTTTAEAAASIGLELAHENEHAVLLGAPTDVDAYHNLMHLFLDGQGPSLADATIDLLKQSDIYANNIKPRRDEFEPQGEDATEFARGYMQGISLANTVVMTMVQHNVTQMLEATKDAPPDIKIEALNSAFRSTLEAGMLSVAMLTASKRAYKMEGGHAAFLDMCINNTSLFIHSYGMPLAEEIIAETTVPAGASVN
jgi:hypothetical protein